MGAGRNENGLPRWPARGEGGEPALARGRASELAGALRDRVGLAAAGHAEEHLLLVTPLEAGQKLTDRGRLVAARLEVARQAEAAVGRSRGQPPGVWPEARPPGGLTA